MMRERDRVRERESETQPKNRIDKIRSYERDRRYAKKVFQFPVSARVANIRILKDRRDFVETVDFIRFFFPIHFRRRNVMIDARTVIVHCTRIISRHIILIDPRIIRKRIFTCLRTIIRRKAGGKHRKNVHRVRTCGMFETSLQ